MASTIYNREQKKTIIGQWWVLDLCVSMDLCLVYANVCEYTAGRCYVEIENKKTTNKEQMMLDKSFVSSARNHPFQDIFFGENIQLKHAFCSARSISNKDYDELPDISESTYS